MPIRWKKPYLIRQYHDLKKQDYLIWLRIYGKFYMRFNCSPAINAGRKLNHNYFSKMKFL